MNNLYSIGTLGTGELLQRLLLATVAGALVGYERETHGHLAGIRTHALVAAGAALFTIVSAYGFPELQRGPNVDPMRVAAQIVSGIGFIGAGAIIRDRGEVRGLTTAAALWASAALGMAAGAGLYWVLVAGLVAVLFTLAGLRLVRDRGPNRFFGLRQSVEVTYSRGFGTLAPVLQAIEDSGATLERLEIEDGEQVRRVGLHVKSSRGGELEGQLRVLAKRSEIHEIVLGGVDLSET